MMKTSQHTSEQTMAVRACEQHMPFVLPFDAIDRTMLAEAGGKGAQLGELAKAGFAVPPGFCVTTAAYALVAMQAALEPVLAVLDHVNEDHHQVQQWAAFAAAARVAILAVPLPEEIVAAVTAAYTGLAGDGGRLPVAVRSSATAEDLPDASFAGQQETYLNIIGVEAVLDAVQRCWASLWTERAVAYRTRQGLNQRAVQLAVVVQQMITPVISGVLFTANPLTNRRQEAVVDALPGLGEALVSGMANPDHWVVDLATMHITQRVVNEPGVVIRPKAGGGTEQIKLPAEQDRLPVVTDRDLLDLVRVGAQVEAHYGTPQDIEWAVDEAGKLWLVQARPITTLFPVPSPQPTEGAVHAYFSFNIAQGVLGPLTPMGLDLFRQMATGIAGLLGLPPDLGRASRILTEAGYRGYVDVTALLRSPVGRRVLRGILSLAEPRTGDALAALLTDPRFASAGLQTTRRGLRRMLRLAVRMHVPERVLLAFVRPDWARQVAQGRAEAFLAEAGAPCADPAAALERAVALMMSVPERALLPLVGLALVPALASFGLARRLAVGAGLDEQMPLVTRGLPYNVTTMMNLDLWQVATQLRADPAANIALGQHTPQALAALYHQKRLPCVLQEGVREFLARYGARGVAEIDVGVPRWRDDPTHVLGVLANYGRLTNPNATPDVQFKRAQMEAETAMADIRTAIGHSGTFGPLQALVLGWLLRRVRALAGMREAPKFYAVRQLGRCRELLEQAGVGLVQVGRLDQADDIFFLQIAEARAAFAGRDQRSLVCARRGVYEREARRKRSPRLLLSDGTALDGEMQAGDGHQLRGTPASPGTYTGIARVVLDPAGARLEPGEILVAPSTDPGWTPLFLTAGGLVMEMGGMMSHGAVVAREYGLPAVVGVLGATTSIHSGQRVTVDGARGVVLLAANEVAITGAAPPSYSAGEPLARCRIYTQP